MTSGALHRCYLRTPVCCLRDVLTQNIYTKQVHSQEGACPSLPYGFQQGELLLTALAKETFR